MPSNSTATVQYLLTNQSSRTHTLSTIPMTGVTQITSGLGICNQAAVLTSKASCTLSLQINGSQLIHSILDGPYICSIGSTNQCYRPNATDVLHITQTTPITTATLSITGSPLTLTTNGSIGTLTITNNSLIVTATNIVSDFTGTALDGNVTETGNTCANLVPGASCILTYTPGNTVVPSTNFTIQGTNTNAVTAAIEIDAGTALTSITPSSGASAGGTGVTLTGSGLIGASSITFGGVSATNVNVINSTTVTAVTPAHAIGNVDVLITTPNSSATLTNSYAYLTTALGQSAQGGIIACLNTSNNLIASTADNGANIEWGGVNIATGSTSNIDGASNTASIVSTLGNNNNVSYAAQICATYEVDSQGNSPCENGNACYHDWFLPAGNNLISSGQLNCLYTNRTAIGGFSTSEYWSSTANSSTQAWTQAFDTGNQINLNRDSMRAVRCVRAFSP